MNEEAIKRLEQLRPVADEMFAGLHADEEMMRRIRAAAREEARGPAKPVRHPALVPALCCAMAVAVFALGLFAGKRTPLQPVEIETLHAGSETAESTGAPNGMLLATNITEGAIVSARASDTQTLFASMENGDAPLVAFGGGVYRMLSAPQAVDPALCGAAVGEVGTFTPEPSLASEDALAAGLSNVVAQGGGIYAIDALDSRTAVTAEVDGRMRVFQRVSYAGRGPGQSSFEDTFSVRGQVTAMELSGAGTLEGDAANDAMAILLDHATLVSADASARGQTLTVTLRNGLQLQLGVSGDTVYGCGGWSCPEFFEAFGNVAM